MFNNTENRLYNHFMTTLATATKMIKDACKHLPLLNIDPDNIIPSELPYSAKL